MFFPLRNRAVLSTICQRRVSKCEQFNSSIALYPCRDGLRSSTSRKCHVKCVFSYFTKLGNFYVGEKSLVSVPSVYPKLENMSGVFHSFLYGIQTGPFQKTYTADGEKYLRLTEGRDLQYGLCSFQVRAGVSPLPPGSHSNSTLLRSIFDILLATDLLNCFLLFASERTFFR